jgi:hypothetical protein
MAEDVNVRGTLMIWEWLHKQDTIRMRYWFHQFVQDRGDKKYLRKHNSCTENRPREVL